MTETEQERARIVAWLRLCAKDDAPFFFDPPSIVVLNAQMDFMNTTIKTIAARKKDWVDNEHGLDTSAEKG